MGLGIPYMGSKRRTAADLVRYMANANREALHFFDLFGGGGAVSFEALRSGFFETVHYNELNTAVVALLKKIRDDGVTEAFYQWVSRDRFFELIEGDDWLAGLTQTCWSFGNGQTTYLYGRDVEQDKKIIHDTILAKSSGIGDIHETRLRVLSEINSRLQNQERIAMLENMARAQHLQALQALQISNKSYQDVRVATPPESTIIYCDIPYKGTKEYKKDGFDHDAFFEWCEQSPYKVYVSSYDAPMNCVYELAHRSTLSATNNAKSVVERLYCNREEKDNGMLF